MVVAVDVAIVRAAAAAPALSRAALQLDSRRILVRAPRTPPPAARATTSRIPSIASRRRRSRGAEP